MREILYEPRHIKVVAKAKAEAAKIQAESEIDNRLAPTSCATLD